VEAGILGPLVVWRDRREVSIGAAKQRAALTVLLLRRGLLVPTETLIEDLWGQQPPATAVKVVHVYVSQLRKALGAGVIETWPGGYLLRIEPDALDVVRFESLLARGQGMLADCEPEAAGLVLCEALALWRGPPLAEFRYEAFALDEIGRLEELRLVAREHRLEAELALGRHAEVVAELDSLVRDHPTRESVLKLFVHALYRAGRQADALATYEAFRAALADDLGLDPSESLQQLHTAILRHDRALDFDRSRAQPSAVVPPSLSGSADTDQSQVADRDAARHATPVGRPRSLSRRGRRLVLALASVVVLAGIGAVVARVGGSPHTTAVAGNYVGLIDGRTARVNTQVSLAGAPTSVAVGEGAVWVANATEGTVSRIDPHAHSVVQTITVGSSPSGIAVGGGGIWVSNHDDNTISWINPRADAVVKVIAVGAGPIAVVYGFGSVWVTNGADRTLTRIDANTGDVITTISTNAVGRGMAVGGGSVWVTDDVTRSVVEVDPSRNEVRSTATVGAGPAGIAYGAGSVWVANSLDDTVSRIDATTHAGLAAIPVPGGPSAVSFTENAVWVSAEFGSRVVRIDPHRSVVTASTPVGNRPQGLAVSDSAVWVAVQASGEGHRGGRLIMLGQGLNSIDPAVGDLDPALQRAAYDGLTSARYTAGSAGTQVVPDLAVALPLPTAHGTRYTFPTAACYPLLQRAAAAGGRFPARAGTPIRIERQ
jgi:YVTN family beta-propeller protein